MEGELTTNRLRGSGLWLFGLGVLLLAAVLAVAWQGDAPPSQAAPPAAGLPVEERVPAGRLLAAEPVTYTTFLPSILSSFEPAWLGVEKMVFPASFVVNQAELVTYTVTISNGGDTTGSLLSIVDTLPAGFTFDTMAPGSDIAAPPLGTTGPITWFGPWTMEPGQEKTLIYRVIPAALAGQYVNEVSVTAQAAHVPAEPARATVEIRPAILMSDSFNAGIAGWTAFLNHHRLEPGQWYFGPGDGYQGTGGLTHDCCTGTKVASDALMMYLQPGAQDWTDYRVETKLYLTGGVANDGTLEPNSGDPIGLWIRGHYQDSELESQWVSGYYVVIVGKATSETHFVRIAKMQQPGDCEACLKDYRMYNFDNPMFKARSADLPGPFEHYRWYTLAVEVEGADFRVYLDGQLVLTWTDPLLPFLSGTVGFKVHETKTASFDDIIVTPLD